MTLPPLSSAIFLRACSPYTYPLGSIKGWLCSFMGFPLREHISRDWELWAKAKGAASSFSGVWGKKKVFVEDILLFYMMNTLLALLKVKISLVFGQMTLPPLSSAIFLRACSPYTYPLGSIKGW